MKRKLVLFSIIIFGINNLFAQTSCKVLMYNISESYQGECKKGLAHGKGIAKGIDTYEGKFKKGYPDGKGTYIWQNGDYYVGKWSKGLRNGEGVFNIKTNNKDSVISGIWEADSYIGPKPIKPNVNKNVGVARYNFIRFSDGDKVTIKLFQNGMINTGVSELFIDADSGYLTNVGNFFVFESIQVPFTCTIRYKTWNRLHTSQNNIIFEFEITQLGKWELIIHS